MSVALVIADEGEAERLLPWAWRVAVSESVDLVIIRVQQRDVEMEFDEVHDASQLERVLPGIQQQWERWTATRSAAAAAEPAIDEGRHAPPAPPPAVKMTVKRLVHVHPDRFLVEQLPRLGVSVLLLPLDERLRDGQDNWWARLYRHVSCQAILLRSTGTNAGPLKRVLVPTAGGDNADSALQRALRIGKAYSVEVTALFVEPPVGRDAEDVGHSILNKIVQRAVGKRSGVVHKVVVADSLLEGVRQELVHDYNLVLVGAYRSRTIRKICFGTVPDQLFAGAAAPSLAVLRAALPASTKIGRHLSRYVRQAVPQLDRDGRVKIVERVQANSKWDFDFIALTCLATLIAALGLAGNQAPVVIGAMLVAPFMTPLIAAGLSLVQGNSALIRDALQSVLCGFLLAFLVGCFVGCVVPLESVPTEVLKRTHPSLLDLGVALVSGVAAAYAMSRPNLVSALPGVAIAAALVPPIATSGLSFALALSHPANAYPHWVHAFGSLVLFATNIVAIVLGTALALWMVGIQPPKTSVGADVGKAWARWGTVLLLMALIGLGFLVSPKRELELVAGGMRQVASEFTHDHAAYAVVTDVRRGTSRHELMVDLESDARDLRDLPQRLQQVAAELMRDPHLRLRLQIKNVVVAEP